MDKKEKEAMRDGFDLCLAKIDHQKKVIGKLIVWLAQELGHHNATTLLNELEQEVKTEKDAESN